MKNKNRWKLMTGLYEDSKQLKIIATDRNDTTYILIGGEHKGTLANFIVKQLNQAESFLQ